MWPRSARRRDPGRDCSCSPPLGTCWGNPSTLRRDCSGSRIWPCARSPYGPGDMPLAQELARRAALALDNARLYQDTVEARASAEQAVERLTLLQRATAGLAGAVTMTS